MKAKERFIVREIITGNKVAYQLTGYKLDGSRVRRRFDTREEAVGEKHLMEVESLEQEAYKPKLTRLTADQIAAAEQAFGILEGKSIIEAARYFVKYYKEPQRDKRLRDAIQEFAEDDRLLEHMRENSRDAIVIQVRSLLKAFPTAFVHEITGEHIESHLKAERASTKRTKRNKLSSFFNWCLPQGYTAANPITGSTKPPERKIRMEQDPEVLNLEQIRNLLLAAQEVQDGALVPFFAIQLFAGIRSEEIKKLRWGMVSFESGLISLSSEVAKTSARRTVEMPINLHEWIREGAMEQKPIIPPNFQKLFRKVREKAGIGRWVRDYCRHTALSYHYASAADKAKTSAWAGNSPQVLDRNYRGLVTPEQAKVYWSLTPASVAEEKIVEAAQ